MGTSPGVARLAPDGEPAAERIPAGRLSTLGSCDATASGAEDAQVRLIRELAELHLCSHHFGELALALIAGGWVIAQDNRGKLA